MANREREWRYRWALLPSAAALAMAAGSGLAADVSDQKDKQQDGKKNEFVRVTSVGDVTTVKTPSDAAIHLMGNIGLDTADYFRGVFDGVPEEIEDGEVAARLGLAVAVELLHNPGGTLTGLSLTAGTGNGLADTPPATEGIWYESNNYVGLAAQFTGGWLAGLTYTAYVSPDIPPSDPPQELAGAIRYTGDGLLGKVKPQVKLAAPVDEEEGWFAQLKLAPSVDIAKVAGGPVSLSFPIAVGAGFDEYYGTGLPDDTGVYGQIGAAVSVPLDVPSAYGSWSFSAGVDLIVRDDTIEAAGGRFDDAGDTVVIGSVGISFVH